MATTQCKRCGAPLAAGPTAGPALQGMCTRCLIELGLEADSHVLITGAEPPAPPPAPEELQPLFPNYRIDAILGQGGMGVVYRATQEPLDRVVALKVLPGKAGRDPAFAERFAREAKALASLNHPNITSVFDYGKAGEHHYLAMELVEGVNLRQLLRTSRVEPKQALRIVEQVCDALQYAHDEGVVHRDIKPENILIDRKGRVKITDFGLAKLLGREETPHSLGLTQTHQVMGTPHYMAPEQVERPADVDHRADIYSLGVVFYELLTGELPLGRFAPPSGKVEVDVKLDEVVLRTLEKEPAMRYQTASAVKTDVHGVENPGAGQPARREAQTPRKERSGKERSGSGGLRLFLVVGGALALLLVVGGLAFALLLAGNVRSERSDLIAQAESEARRAEWALYGDTDPNARVAIRDAQRREAAQLAERQRAEREAESDRLMAALETKDREALLAPVMGGLFSFEGEPFGLSDAVKQAFQPSDAQLTRVWEVLATTGDRYESLLDAHTFSHVVDSTTARVTVGAFPEARAELVREIEAAITDILPADVHDHVLAAGMVGAELFPFGADSVDYELRSAENGYTVLALGPEGPLTLPLEEQPLLSRRYLELHFADAMHSTGVSTLGPMQRLMDEVALIEEQGARVDIYSTKANWRRGRLTVEVDLLVAEVGSLPATKLLNDMIERLRASGFEAELGDTRTSKQNGLRADGIRMTLQPSNPALPTGRVAELSADLSYGLRAQALEHGLGEIEIGTSTQARGGGPTMRIYDVRGTEALSIENILAWARGIESLRDDVRVVRLSVRDAKSDGLYYADVELQTLAPR